MHYKKIAYQVYKKFSSIDGNQYIAGDYALEIILRIIIDFKITKVLEIGLGIGTISETVLLFSKENDVPISYFGTEENNFCLKALPLNVLDFNEIALYRTISDIPKSETFNFIIVDGSDASLSQIKKRLVKNAIIFIEGGRQSQIDTIKKIYPRALVAEVVSVRKPPSYGPFYQKWTGSGSIIFCEPLFYQKLYWFKEKVQSYSKRRIRKYLL